MEKATPIYDRAMHEARAYWREQCSEASFVEQLALDHPRPRDGVQEGEETNA